MIFPDSGSTIGSYKLAVFGLNFVPSAQFHLRFGPQVVSREIEFHSSTSLIATIHVGNTEVMPGVVKVTATNDGGVHFGPSAQFRFFDPVSNLQLMPAEERMVMVTSQLENIRRSILQLRAGVVNVQRMEIQLKSQIEGIDLSNEDVKTITEETANLNGKLETSTATRVEQKAPQSIGAKPENSGKGQAGVGSGASSSTSAALSNLKIIKPEDREIRLFISSPFRDMQEERDTIVKHVLPLFRKICNERDINFSYVDLRWGVTGIQNEQAATLLMCLREVEKCNIFIGCWGERYGWCLSQNASRNPTPSDDLLKRSLEMAAKEFPWVNEFRDRSVTEIEMRMVKKVDRMTKKKAMRRFFFGYYFIFKPKKKKS